MIEYMNVNIKAISKGEFMNGKDTIEHANISIDVPLEEKEHKKWLKLKDDLIKNVIAMYKLEDQIGVDILVTYEYFGVNGQED